MCGAARQARRDTFSYKWQNTPRMLYIYIDPTGLVQRYHTGDDLMLDLLAPL